LSRVGPVTNEPDLTFMFHDSKVGGVTCSSLLDSGAMDCFIHTDFARKHGFTVLPNSPSYELADGNVVSTDGTVSAKFRLQGYSREIRFVCMKLSDGIDIILGDDWAKREQAIIDYGTDEPVYRPPSVWLGRSHITVRPTHDNGEQPGATTMISARKALRLLAAPRRSCKPAFVVLVKESSSLEQDPDSKQIDPDTSILHEYDEPLKELLTEYASIFEPPMVAEHDSSTPECIRLKADATPPHRPAFRLSLPERQELEKQVKTLLEAGRIEPSCSSYGAPVLFVPKPDGSLRMCIDYRALNKLTVKNKYPLPRIDDLMDNLSGARCFSSLDLTSGYHQITLHPNDCEKTAFNTHIGKYEWRVLPFGLTNAPAVFQSIMNKLFGPGLNKFLCVYLDDLLVFSKTPEEHLQHLKWVFDRLTTSKLKARESKCHFFRRKLNFLGHVVSAEGMAPDPAKIETIVNWPKPRSLFEVRSFLGLANYFRRFIEHYSQIAAPLTALLKGGEKKDRQGRLLNQGKLKPEQADRLVSAFEQTWTPKCDTAFAQLKNALVQAPVLVLPDFDKPFTLVCDACDTAIGGILLQESRPVAYYSRKLNGPELRYSASDKEMLGVIAGLREWRCYLEGRPFVIETDHQPNTYLDELPPSAHSLKRRARWLAESGGFDYTWKYRPGATNVADPVSRAPQHLRLCAVKRSKSRPKSDNDLQDPEQPEHNLIDIPRAAGVSDAVLEQVGCFVMKGLVARLKEGYAHARTDPKQKHEFETLTADKEGLFWTAHDKLWVPNYENLRADCIEVVHSHPYAGHYGVRRTHHLLSRTFHWTGMLPSVQAFVRRCDSCQRIKAPRQSKYGKLHPLQVPERRWQSVSLDLITDLPVTSRGHDTIVVFVDRLSKMVHIEAATKSITSEGLAELFESRVIRYHGVPQTLVSDRDIRFRSQLWYRALEIWGIKHCRSTGKHPQTDGQTENANGVLEDTLRHFVGPYQSNWDKLLPAAEFSMNNSVNVSTGYTPFMLNYGQNPDTPLTVVLRGLNPQLDRFRGRWSEQLKHARECLLAAQQRQKAHADKHRRDAPELNPGDQVLIHMKHFRLPKGLKLKLAPRFLGPFTVKECIGPANLSYRVDLPPPLHRMHNVFHVSSLRVYHGEGSYQPPRMPPVEDGVLAFQGDYISDTRGTGPRRQYRVHWLGGGDTWELARRLYGGEPLIDAYWASRNETVPPDGKPWSTDTMAQVLGGEHPF
jgi:Reverse transcriptase (RNA-dependent DNA polymerase)/RNase H-like domain found in reverse transcriptase/Integrase zinc binding domain/Aspartyl protease